MRDGLDAERVSLRRQAATRLAELSPALARSLVRRALSDPDDVVRARAAEAALVHGYADLGQLVLEWLSGPEADLRALALRLLALAPASEALAPLGRAMTDVEPELRGLAARALGRVSWADRQRATEFLLAGLDDPDFEVRRLTIAALGRIGTSEAALPVAARLRDPEPEVRSAAAVALGAVGEAQVAGTLMLALEDRDPGVAAASARSLGWLRSEVAVHALLEHAAADSPELRRSSRWALGQIGGRAAAEGLVMLLAAGDDSSDLLSAVESVGASAAVALRECILREGPLGALACARALSRLPGTAGDLVSSARRGYLPTARTLQLMVTDGGTSPEIESLVFALEILENGELQEARVALEHLEQAQRLPAAFASGVGRAVRRSHWSSSERARLLSRLAAVSLDGVAADEAEQVRRLAYVVAKPFEDASRAELRAAARRVLFVAEPTIDRLRSLLDDPDGGVRAAVAEQLALGMSPELSHQLLTHLVEGKIRHRSLLLRGLWGVPPDLPEEDVGLLHRLFLMSRDGQRDLVLMQLAQLDHADRFLLRVAEQGSVSDREVLAHQVALARPRPQVAAVLANDPLARVRALAWQAITAQQLNEVEQPSASDTAYLRAASEMRRAQLGLSRDAVGGGDVARSHQLAPTAFLRIAQLWRAASKGVDEKSRVLLADRNRLDEHPAVRMVAAALLADASELEPFRVLSERALRGCAIYDVAPRVAELCAAHLTLAGSVGDGAENGREPSEQRLRLLLSPMTGQPAASAPLVLLNSQSGRVLLGMSGRAGRYMLPSVEDWALEDPSLAY